MFVIYGEAYGDKMSKTKKKHVKSSGGNIEFVSPEARRMWESSMATLRQNQERLKRIGIVSLMKVDRDEVLMSISLSSVVKAIGKQIVVTQGRADIELKEKAIVVTITK